MKLVVGAGSIEEYIPYVKAGADEIFCGYIPEEWSRRYSVLSPLNRREVLYYNVQLGSESELQILEQMVKVYKVPVTITLNSLSYTQEQYPMIYKIIETCKKYGFSSFIIADFALLLYLKMRQIQGITIHISGEMAEFNRYMIEEMREFDAGRIIFHRKNTISDMAACIKVDYEAHPEAPLEYEAFVLNEKCHFTGAFCNSLHCDEMAHICHLPYRVEQPSMKSSFSMNEKVLQNEEEYITGRTGCGLCALWRLRQAGVTHLKLVSRGNYAEDTIMDIRQLKYAMQILEESETEASYIKAMKEKLFQGKCSGNCYYPIFQAELT